MSTKNSRPLIISSGWMLAQNGGMQIPNAGYYLAHWTRAWDAEKDYQMTWYDMCLRLKKEEKAQ